MQPPFHLAIPVDDLDKARAFYCGLLGCRSGREAARWLDLDFFGHQVTLHLVDRPDRETRRNPVDADNVPVRHFGVVLPSGHWDELCAHLRANNTVFRIAPTIRFMGEIGEQRTMFLDDPSGNALEFKSFADPDRLFRK